MSGKNKAAPTAHICTHLLDGEVFSEAAEVVGADAQQDLLPFVLVQAHQTHVAHAHVALRVQFCKRGHEPTPLLHHCDDAGVLREAAQQFSRSLFLGQARQRLHISEAALPAQTSSVRTAGDS